MSEEKITAEWLERQIRDLAQSGEGADRRWALKVLREETQGETAFQKPLTDQEVVDRLARMMRGAGIGLTRAAYIKAYGTYKATVEGTLPEMGNLDIDVEDLPKTLKQYYTRYPDFKRPGYPEGYPLKDPVRQMLFIQKLSIEREKERRDMLGFKTLEHITHVSDLGE